MLKFSMIEGELRASAGGHSRHIVVDLSFATTTRDQFEVTALGFEDTSDGKKALNVVRINELLATEDIDEVESLR